MAKKANLARPARPLKLKRLFNQGARHFTVPIVSARDIVVIMFKRVPTALIVVFSVFIGIGNLSAAQKFIPGLNDLPLMPGLILKSETPVVFDTPGGRIVEVFAAGNPPVARIRSFYGETLPQLGWKPKSASTFQRDKEVLKIEISEDGKDRRIVRFSVVPKSK